MSHPFATMQVFGTMPDGREVKIFTLVNAHGMVAQIMELGATLVSLEMPDRTGLIADVTLGHDDFSAWLSNSSYFGSTIGRFANRIKDGKFSLEGKTYQLATNNAPGGIPCHLHGGAVGFDQRLWAGVIVGNTVTFRYCSRDGEEGYPGNLNVAVTYTLTDDNELIWEATATTDAPTIINLAHHTYWNLSGDPRQSIHDHLLQIEADHFLPTDAGMIPTGEIAAVATTPMDFTTPVAVGARVDVDYEPLKFAGGYDHCWILRGDGMRLAARLFDPSSGRAMDVVTNQPGIQCYGGNFLDGKTLGKNGIAYQHRTGICLETQNFPDAPNHPHFPNAVLRPGETYQHRTIHSFSVKPTLHP
jgi:aldose 1-epimerase